MQNDKSNDYISLGTDLKTHLRADFPEQFAIIEDTAFKPKYHWYYILTFTEIYIVRRWRALPKPVLGMLVGSPKYSIREFGLMKPVKVESCMLNASIERNPQTFYNTLWLFGEY